MIEVVREWITSIVMVTMLLTVAQSMIPEGRIQKIFSFSGGLVLLIALLQPVLNLDPVDVDFRMETYAEEVRIRQEELTQSVGAEWETIIEQETAAYISDKASELGVQCTAEVTFSYSEEGVAFPTAATVRGKLTQKQRDDLTRILESELAIPKEKQTYEGVNEP